jgi:hypothetical protein
LNLGNDAFLYCSSLQSISLPASIKVISHQCFAHCRNLLRVDFESGYELSRLDESAFEDCPRMNQVPLSESPCCLLL